MPAPKHGPVIVGDRTIEILMWALALRKDPTPTQIAARWDVSRATSYRYLPKLVYARELFAMQRMRTREPGALIPNTEAVPLEGLFQ